MEYHVDDRATACCHGKEQLVTNVHAAGQHQLQLDHTALIGQDAIIADGGVGGKDLQNGIACTLNAHVQRVAVACAAFQLVKRAVCYHLAARDNDNVIADLADLC